eukprot:g13171.t1
MARGLQLLAESRGATGLQLGSSGMLRRTLTWRARDIMKPGRELVCNRIGDGFRLQTRSAPLPSRGCRRPAPTCCTFTKARKIDKMEVAANSTTESHAEKANAVRITAPAACGSLRIPVRALSCIRDRLGGGWWNEKEPAARFRAIVGTFLQWYESDEVARAKLRAL